MQLFFHPAITENDREVHFSRDESRHIVKVLRKKEGDLLHITNGKGWTFETELVAADPRTARAKVLRAQKDVPPPYHLHMAVAPTKMNDRYEWFLEKATEIGVHEITPIICEHSERKVVKTERLERVLQSALKQSLHTHFPVLNAPVNLTDFLKSIESDQKFIAHCEEEGEKRSLFREIKKNSEVTILIGPEGDFSVKEIEMALQHGWTAVSLGNSRLRTETAAIVACHTTAIVNEQE